MISPPSDVQNPPPAKVSVGNMPSSPRPRIPAWEHRLPRPYIVASTPSVNSLKLQVEIETTDTQQLREHNPEIDWTKEEAQKEHRVKVRERAAVHACRAGHLPFANLDLLNPPPLAFPHREALYEDVRGAGCEPQEEDGCEGDFASMQDPESPDETIEAFAANSQPKPSHSIVPHHLHDFEDVFSKASFDSLPERKQWDHAIELIPDAEPSSCKVYPLVPHEQDELDAFLQENLSSGRIQPSKSPMASPVFFIKKKDGSLHLVQDY
ncbi:hypothetical protein E4T56_gene10572 [Termitomyces sp. T112]|nr:hypothetical protein E4T56_gene10572 [Termitomyces sp. T112]